MEAAFTTHVAPCRGVALIAFLVFFTNFVSGERPSEVYTRSPKPVNGRDGRFAVKAEPDDAATEALDVTPDAGTDDEETKKEHARHGLGPRKGNQASIERRKRRRDPLEGMYFHDSEKASQLVERDARKIDQEATKAEDKAKNVTAEISKYDKKLKDLLKSLRRLAKKQQAYATQVNAEYMDKEYGPEGRLQAFTDFDLQKVRPFGETRAEDKTKKVQEAATMEDDTADDSADVQRTVETLANAEKTARVAQKLSTKLAAKATCASYTCPAGLVTNLRRAKSTYLNDWSCCESITQARAAQVDSQKKRKKNKKRVETSEPTEANTEPVLAKDEANTE